MKIPARILDEYAEQYPQEVSANPHTLQKTLERLVESKFMEVRLNVANHEKTSTKALKKLATDDFVQIRVAVAKNKKVLHTTLKMLLQDRCLRVRYVAQRSIYGESKVEVMVSP